MDINNNLEVEQSSSEQVIQDDDPEVCISFPANIEIQLIQLESFKEYEKWEWIFTICFAVSTLLIGNITAPIVDNKPITPNLPFYIVTGIIILITFYSFYEFLTRKRQIKDKRNIKKHTYKRKANTSK